MAADGPRINSDPIVSFRSNDGRWENKGRAYLINRKDLKVARWRLPMHAFMSELVKINISKTRHWFIPAVQIISKVQFNRVNYAVKVVSGRTL